MSVVPTDRLSPCLAVPTPTGGTASRSTADANAPVGDG